jgi:hypothetical protein
VFPQTHIAEKHTFFFFFFFFFTSYSSLSLLSRLQKSADAASLRAHAGYGGASTPSRHRWGCGKHLSLQAEISSTRNLVPFVHQKNQIQGDDCNQ